MSESGKPVLVFVARKAIFHGTADTFRYLEDEKDVPSGFELKRGRLDISKIMKSRNIKSKKEALEYMNAYWIKIESEVEAANGK